MGKRIRNLSFMAALTVLMTMTSCKNTPKYVSMIPDDAVIVMRYDIRQIAEKSGAGNELLKNKLQEMMKGTEMSAETRGTVDKLLDDPAETGIDLRDPLVAYITAEDNMSGGALLGTIHDAEKLEELLNTISKEAGTETVKRSGDIRYCHEGGYILAFNDDVLCIKKMESFDERHAVADVKAVLSGKRRYAAEDNGFLSRLFDCDGIIQVLVMGDIYNKIPEMATAVKSMPEGLDVKDAAYLLDMTVGKGEVIVNGELLSSSGGWEKWIEKGDNLFAPINGDMLEYVSKNGLAVMLNCDGAKTLSFLKENGLLDKVGKDDTEMAFKLLSSIDGNIIIGMDKMNIGSGIPDVAVYAKTKDSSISDTFGALFKGKVNVGYKDNVTYCLTGTGNEPFRASQNPFGAGDVKGKLLYYYFNFTMLGEMSGKVRGGEAVAVNAVKDILEYGEISYGGKGKAQLRIVMRDKSKYPIEAIAEYLVKNIN